MNKKKNLDASFDKKKVVVIDDEEAIINLVLLACEKLGYQVEATTSSEQFQKLVLQNPDFIIMDLMMPGVDGVELFRYLAANDVKGSLILMSGAEQRVILSAARLAESQGLLIQGTLAKPFTLKDISEILGKIQEERIDKIAPVRIQPEKHDLVKALERKEIYCYFQPQVDFKSNNIVSCEALARWLHPKWGIIMPDQFIPVIVKSNMMSEFTNYISSMTLKQLSRFSKSGYSIPCSINISASSLTDIGYPDYFLKLLENESIKPQDIILEVTESELFEDTITTMDVLTRLRMKGFKLSIDDFGTGYSTFLQLQRIPCSELKIDKQFVLNCLSDYQSETIVRTSIELAQRLGIRTVAEGVESKQVANRLRDWGCTLGQGYFYTKALPPDEFISWVKNFHGNANG